VVDLVGKGEFILMALKLDREPHLELIRKPSRKSDRIKRKERQTKREAKEQAA
jgi:hypothetical protein